MNQSICSRHKAHEKLLAVMLTILLAALPIAQTNPVMEIEAAANKK